MKAALINGSPKQESSASAVIVDELKSILHEDMRLTEYSFREPVVTMERMREMSECDVWIFAFPLYVGSIPSHLLSCLMQLEDYLTELEDKEITVYTVVNCGFYEARQNAPALEIMKNWCRKCGLIWGIGVGVGGGGMLPMLKEIPAGRGPRKRLSRALAELADDIKSRTAAPDILVKPGIPRFLYKAAAEMGWRQQIKKDGKEVKDLSITV